VIISTYQITEILCDILRPKNKYRHPTFHKLANYLLIRLSKKYGK